MSQIACRGIRGATTSDNNDRESIIDATKKLLESIVNENDLNVDDIAAAFFTTTKASLIANLNLVNCCSLSTEILLSPQAPTKPLVSLLF